MITITPVPRLAQYDTPVAGDCKDEDGILRIYMRDAVATPLLTRAEECKLARRIKRGDRAARDHMIKANLRLVVRIAYGYRFKGLSLSDLISEGNIGLMRAVDRFDPTFKAKFSTYAAWWIRQTIKVGLANTAKTIRLPVYLAKRLGEMGRVSTELTETFGRDPTTEEIAEEMDLPANKVAILRTVSAQPASLQASYGPMGEGAVLGDIVPDDQTLNPQDALEQASTREALMAAVESLEPREAMILKRRFGLDGLRPATLDDLGRKYRVTRERIRQLEDMALRELRLKFRSLMRQRSQEDIDFEELVSDQSFGGRERLTNLTSAARLTRLDSAPSSVAA